MKIQRTKNAVRNIIFTGGLKIYEIVVPFLMRTLILYVLGVEYLGLNSLFVSILQVLNLAELGVGSAMVFSFYKPVAEDDTETICALMALYRKFYRIIGLFIAVAGIALTPFLKYLVKGDIPSELNLYVLYFMNLAATVLSYWLFAYKNCLLSAHQREDVGSKVNLGVNTAQYLLMILAICIFKSYYLYLGARIFAQIASNISAALVVGKMYPDYHPKGKLPKEKVKDITGRIKDLFTARLGGVILNSADSIVISAFLGLTILAIHQNYFFIITSVEGLIAVILLACTAGIGNSLITETKQKNFNDFRKLTFLYCWIVGCCASLILCLYQSFMTIWAGEELLLPFGLVISFVIYFYSSEINRLLNTYKDAAGIWHQDRFRPFVAAVVNITLNLLTVQFLGLFGVIISSVVAIIALEIPWLLHNLFKYIFIKTDLKEYILSLLYYTLVIIIACAASYGLCCLIPVQKWTAMLIYGVIGFFVPNLLFYIIYRKKQEFEESKELVRKIIEMFKGKFSK